MRKLTTPAGDVTIPVSAIACFLGSAPEPIDFDQKWFPATGGEYNRTNRGNLLKRSLAALRGLLFVPGTSVRAGAL